MTHHQDDSQGSDAFENELRRSAQSIRPRADFVRGLRQALETRPAKHAPFSLRRYLPQAALFAALGALVVLAIFLTPSIVRAPGPGGQISDNATAVPGQPRLIQGGSLPNGALARLGSGQVLSFDVAPDERLAVASTMGVCVYQAEHELQWCQEMGSPYSLGWLLFNPAGDRLALVSTNPAPDGLTTRVLVLDAASGEVLAERSIANVQQYIAYTDAAIAWDPTGAPRLALPGVNRTLQVWDWESNANVLGPLDMSDLISSTNPELAVDWALDPQGRALLAVGGSEGLMIVDTITGVEVLRMDRTQPSAPVGNIATLDFSEDASWLAYGYANGAAAIHIQGDQITGQREWKTFYQPRQVAFGGGSMAGMLAVQEVGYISMYSTDDSHAADPTSLDRIPSSFGPFEWDSGGSLYYLRGDGRLGARLDGQDSVLPMQYSNWPERIAWSGPRAVTALRNAIITSWDVANQALGSINTAGEPDQNLDDLAISADGSRAAYYISGADAVQVSDLAGNRPIARLAPVDSNAQAVFSVDNSRLVTIDRTGSLIVWDAASGEQIRAMQAATRDAQLDALAVSPNGVLAALAWYDRSALRLDLWNLEAAKVTATISLDTNAHALAFSPDSTRLAEVSSGYVTVWDAATGQKVQSMGPEVYDMASDVVYQVQGSAIEALAWSPDGRSIATGGGLVMLWDVQEGLPRMAFGGHRGYVNALAFRPDGRALASASNDGTILVWDTGAGPQPTAQASAPPDLANFEVTQTSSTSPDGKWTADILYAQAGPESMRQEDYHRLIVSQTTAGQPEPGWQFEQWTDAVQTRTGYSEIKWDGDRLYWYENVSNLDVCHRSWSTNLRWMDLTTGAVAIVPGFGPEWQGNLAFSPDKPMFAYLDGAALVVESLAKERARIPFKPIDPNSWGARALYFRPGDYGVVLVQHRPANLMCDGGEVREGLVVFDLANNHALQQDVPEGYQFRDLGVAGSINLLGPDGNTYQIDMSTGELTAGLTSVETDGDAATLSYTVVDGDTCYGIAATFKIPVSSLIALNLDLDAHCTNLFVGQILTVPGPASQVVVEYGPRTEGDAEAAQALEDFLTALASRDYARAAQFYSGELALGDQSFEDAAALLQYACESGGVVCLPPKKITAKSYLGAMGGFDFTVTYAGAGGADFSLDGQQEFIFSVRPGAPGPYRVVNLPLRN